MISKAVGIVAGWAVCVIVGVRLVDGGVILWRHQTEELTHVKEKLSRLQGWLLVEKEIAARREEIFGPLAHQTGDDIGWVCLRELQRVAREHGLTVVELRPSQVPAERGRPSFFRLHAKLEGEIKQMNNLLMKIPDAIPGVHLENVQFSPEQKDNQFQMLLQLALPEVPH